MNVHDVLSNVKDVTAQLEKDSNLEKTLANFKAASARLKIILDSLDKTMDSVLPRLDVIVQDLNQLTEKLKAATLARHLADVQSSIRKASKVRKRRVPRERSGRRASQ